MVKLCLGFDDTHVYAIKGNAMTSYDINNGTTSTFNGGVLGENTNFSRCMTVGGKTYAISQDLNLIPTFETYQFLYTHQMNQLPINYGQPNYSIKLSGFDIYTLISFSPIRNNDDNNVCVLVSTNNPNFNGLYKYCGSGGPESIPFNDSIQSKPLIGVNKDFSTVFLFGYPDKNHISAYSSSLGDLSKPLASYYFIDGIPSSGSVQVINDNATEFIVYDYDRTIYHITLPNLPTTTNNNAQSSSVASPPQTATNDFNKRQQPNQPTASSKTYALENSITDGDVITLNNNHLFSASDVTNGIQFKEEPVLVSSVIQVPQSSQPTNNIPSSSVAGGSSSSNRTIIIVASVVGGIFVLLSIALMYYFCNRIRKRRSIQASSSSSSSSHHHHHQQRYRILDEEVIDDPPPLYSRFPESDNNNSNINNSGLQINTTDNNNSSNNINEQDDDYIQQYNDNDNDNNNNNGSNQSQSSRNGSIRRGIDTFIMRMTSLRRLPQSPASSIFSFFSNGMNPSSPVEDKYQKVKKVNFPSNISNLLEPINNDTNDSLILNGRYHLVTEEAEARFDENARIPGYTTRTVQHIKSNKIRTLHYYLKDQRDSFLRNINVSVSLKTSKHIIRHYDALTIEKPTDKSSYQHFWLSTPCISKQSLHYLIHHDKHTLIKTRTTAITTTMDGDDSDEDNNDNDRSNIDDNDGDDGDEFFYFITLSILSILKCIQDVHTADYCHLGLSLRSFYYEKPSSITDWYVTGFDQSLLIGHSDELGLKLDIYSAPELITSALTATNEMKENNNRNNNSNHLEDNNNNSISLLLKLQCYNIQAQFEMDTWSLGCILFEMMTDKPLFNDLHQYIQLCEQSPIINHDSTNLVITPLQSHLNQAFHQVKHIHPSFKTCLELLLQVDYHQRESIQNVMNYWIETHQLMDELE